MGTVSTNLVDHFLLGIILIMSLIGFAFALFIGAAFSIGDTMSTCWRLLRQEAEKKKKKKKEQ